MPADIPGFYFDVSKNKYFRIQPNHVAPTKSKYSTQAVIAERKLKDEQVTVEARRAYIWGTRLTRSPYLQHPLLGLPLRRQLGNLSLSSATIIKQSWASMLHERDVYRNLGSEVFTVEKESKQLFALSKPRSTRVAMEWVREFCFSKPSLKRVRDEDDDEHDEETERTVWSKNFTVPIHDAVQDLRCVEAISRDLVVWVTRSVEAGPGAGGGAMADYVPGGEGSRVCFSRRRDWGWPGEDYGDWGTSVVTSASIIWDLKASGDRRRVVFGDDAALSVCDIEKGVSEGMWGVRKLGQEKWRREWMCVGWKGENVVIGGDRKGEVWLADVRIGGGAVKRARCPWAVSSVRSTSGEGLLVWGLEGGRLFDLRFNKNEKEKSANGKKMTKPAVGFDMKAGSTQKRYGLGWDYDEQLGMVASATTDLFHHHRVRLWDVSTGRMLEESPLVQKRFHEPVTCIQMVDLNKEGGVKSLLTACDGSIGVWEV